MTELKSYPNHTKAQLEEIVSIQDEMIAWTGQRLISISVPFTIEDCECLRNGETFTWEFDWIILDIYNSDTDPRDDEEIPF